MASRRRSIVDLEEQLSKNLESLKAEREKMSQAQEHERAEMARVHTAGSAYLNGRIHQAEEALKSAQLEEEPAAAAAEA